MHLNIWTVKYIGTRVFISGLQFYYSSVCLFIAFCFTVGLNVFVCNCLYYCITSFTFVVSRKRRFPPCHYPKLVNLHCFYSALLYTVNLFKVWMNEWTMRPWSSRQCRSLGGTWALSAQSSWFCCCCCVFLLLLL